MALIGELHGLYNDLSAAGACTGANCTGTIGGFSGIQSVYWSGTVVSTGFSPRSSSLEFDNNFEGATKVGSLFSAWAVRSGNTTAVPEPQTVALLLFGLGLLGWRTKRR